MKTILISAAAQYACDWMTQECQGPNLMTAVWNMSYEPPHDSILLIDRQAVFDDTGKIIIPGTRLRNDSPIMNKCQDLVRFLNEHKISYLAVEPYGTAYVELPWRSGIIYQFLISPDDCLHLTALRYFKISCDTNEISRFRDSRLYILPEECAVVQSEDFGFATLF